MQKMQLLPAWGRQQLCLGTKARQSTEHPLLHLSLISLRCWFQRIRPDEQSSSQCLVKGPFRVFILSAVYCALQGAPELGLTDL